MGKVNCDFCGTAFSDSAEKCPLCGFARNVSVKAAEESLLLDDEFGFLRETEIPRRKNRPIFDYDEVNPDEEVDSDENEDDEEYDSIDDEEDDEEPRSNILLIVILVIVIALLLLASGFVFFRYFLPNVMGTEETTLATTEETPALSEESTIPTVPCQMLALTSEAAELNQAGQPWLLHVTVTPENTTDELVYVSEDESVATVSDDGKIIAVGEGETFIKIICGEQIIKCPVIVDYDMVIDESQEEGVPTMGVEESADPSEPSTSSDDQQTETATQTTEEQGTTSEPVTEDETSGEVVLKLKETDISLSKTRGITYELTLDCDVTADQVEWITMNSNVLLVKDGVITVMGPGTTKVVAKYNGQSVECIVRCVF